MKRKMITFIVMALVITCFSVSCSISSSSEAIKPDLEKVLSLNLLGDKELKEEKSLNEKEAERYRIYYGENGRYIFDSKSGELKIIVRRKPLANKGVEKTKDELVRISDKLLKKINEKFYKKDLEKKVSTGDKTILVTYREKKNDVLQPNACRIKLLKSGDFSSYSHVKIDTYEEDNSKYTVTEKEAIELAKKDLFKRFKIDEKSFNQKEGEVLARKVNHKGKNVWQIDLSYTDGYDKGGAYFIDNGELKIIKFEKYK